MIPAVQLTRALRAAADPVRLQILQSLAEREWHVGELATMLHKSEPRISQQLKVLAEAGLVSRRRAGQHVAYRLTDDEALAALANWIIAQLEDAPQSIVSEARLGRALAIALEASTTAGKIGRALLLGQAPKDVVQALGRMADSTSRSAARQERFDFVCLDVRHLHSLEGVRKLLVTARVVLPAEGSLWFIARYELFERTSGNVVHHPIGALRHLLAEAGFGIDRLKPIEADGEHILVASAHRTAAPTSIATADTVSAA